MMFINGIDAHYYETTFPRTSTETLPDEHFSARTSFEQNLDEFTLQSITFVDANSWMYTAKATLLQDLAHVFSSLEWALSQIAADVLMIPC
ncbi:homoserine O-succinyltransferase, partial [Bacillus pseudomycoides]|nr:homoserine O-succinyltransferase [Bacillus pseudomycoides]